MHMEEHQTEPAATGSGGMGSGETTLTEGVEPISCAAAGGRLQTHPNSSFSATCLGDPQETPESSSFFFLV